MNFNYSKNLGYLHKYSRRPPRPELAILTVIINMHERHHIAASMSISKE